MFEKIYVAYELLCSIDMEVCNTDMLNIFYLVKTQNIVYRRFREQVGNQKYPAYPLLVSVLAVPSTPEEEIGIQASQLLVEGVKLMYHTCAVSPLNGFEFVKSGCVKKLYELVRYGLALADREESSSHIPDLSREILVFGMKAFAVVASLDMGRTEIQTLCPQFACDMMKVIKMSSHSHLRSRSHTHTHTHTHTHLSGDGDVQADPTGL